jgi:hypothetical protein
LIVIVPQCRRDKQKQLFELALIKMKEIGDLANKVIEVNGADDVSVYDLPKPCMSAGLAAAARAR